MSLLTNAHTSRMGGAGYQNRQVAFNPMTKAQKQAALERAAWLRKVRASARS